jgi:tRNA (guanine-N7-)-methyltransferase
MTAEAKPRRPHPYAHAARLPSLELGERVDVNALLPGDGPLEIEIGPGRGNFVFERVIAAPESRLLAFEIRLKWAQIVDERLGKRGFHHRARVLAEDAKAALARLSPEGSVKRFFVHFPDPWWKKRHAKRLVVGNALLDSIVWLLEDDGELFVQTDVDFRAEGYENVVEGYADLVPAGDEEGQPFLAANPYGARSNREVRADEDGLPVTRMRWKRRPRPLAAE